MKIKGKSLMLTAENKTIALAINCSFNTTTQISDSRTKDDATGPAGDFESVDWNASSDNIVGANEKVTNEMVYADLLEKQLSGTVLKISVMLAAAATGAIPEAGWEADKTINKAFVPYEGNALIESVSLNAPQEGNATVSVNFKAVGPLTKVA